MIPEALKQAKSIEEVVQIIDNGGTESQSPEELAASFAYLAALKKDSPAKEDIQVELRKLMEEGARFDYALALEYAESWLIDALNKATASQGL
ncbi:hypothetical protein [Methylophaga pinxianii]|uniref:hypothetical protein n=1 Tax=Methylophaga pinxianii TaxID=2881052 RepID=UPI001CF12C38|nr:hypothetical protein [Methylophaga pinxianii]MCB2425699.1 hypothetical protein [Methylophaga pinxianii]UPH44705.1 hypothetical protein LGT42_009285 [Methylophaga pinxianii]